MKWILIYISAIVLSSSCIDKNKILSGNEFPFHDESGAIYSKVIFPSRLEQLTATVNRGKGNFLQLGNYANLSSSIAIRFPLDTTRAVIVDSLWLYFEIRHVYKNAPGEISVEVHEILNDWNDEDANPSIEIDPKVITEVKFSSEDTIADIIVLPRELGQRWIDNPFNVYGLLLKCTGGEVMKEYYSGEGQEFAEDENLMTSLRVIGQTAGTTIYPQALPRDDISLFTGSEEAPSDRITIDDWRVFRGFIQFSLDSVPSTATINKALLLLNMDKEQSIFKDNATLFQGHLVNENYSGGGAPVFDADSAIGRHYNYQMAMDMTGQTQFLLIKKIPNYGLVLKTSDEGNDISRFVFYTASADTSVSPKLILFYTLPVRRY